MSSKQMKRMVVVMVVLLLFAAAGYLITDAVLTKKEKEAAEEEASMHLFSFDPNSIDTVTLDTKEGFFQMEIVDSEWAMTEMDYPYDFVLNKAYVSVVCSYLSELTALTKFESEDASLADYGLEDPVVLTCSAGATDYVLHVGNATPTQEYFYVMVPGNDTVYGVDFQYGSLFYGDTTYLKSPYMLNYLDVEIAELKLEREGEVVYDLVQGDSGWRMEAPLKDGSINAAQVNSLTTALVRMEVESFVGLTAEGYDPADYGLEDPFATLTVRSYDGRETIIDFAEYDLNNGIIHMFYRNEQEIASMATTTANFVNTEISELLMEYVMKVSYDDTASLEVAVDDVSFRMDMDAAAGSQSFDGVDIAALGGDCSSTFRALFDSVSNLRFETVKLDAEVDLTAEPAAVFRYTLHDGTVRELALLPADDNTYYTVVDGTYSGMTVRRRSLSGSTGVLDFQERMVDAIAEAQESAS